MALIIWVARRLQDLISAIVEGLALVLTALFTGVGYVLGVGFVAAVSVGLPLVALYFFVRFIKWAWAD